MKEEQIDIYNEEMVHIGTAPREEVHKRGHWHQTFHCWLISREDDKQYIIFQKRHPGKDTFPNRYDITAAGHLMAGESPTDGIREVQEELGIDITFEDLQSLGIIKYDFHSDELIDREFCHVFLSERNIPFDEYNPQLEEVTGLVKLDMDEAKAFFSGKREYVHAVGVELDDNGAKTDFKINLLKEDFIMHEFHYYLFVLEQAQDYFEKNKEPL